MLNWLIGDITGDLVILMYEMVKLMNQMFLLMKYMAIGGGLSLFIIWITIILKKRK